MTCGFKNGISNLVNLHASSCKSTVCNVLAEGMLFFLRKPHQVSTFWTSHCLSEVAQIPVIFETYLDFAPCCNILATKT